MRVRKYLLRIILNNSIEYIRGMYMEEKSLIKVENSIFSKIKSFFRNIFKKNKIDKNATISYSENVEESDISDSLQELVQNEISKEMKEKIEGQDIELLMNKVGTSKEELMKLDIETLRKIDNHYIKKVEIVDEKIANLKTKLSTN